MKWSSANAIVERLRADTRLYLPALSASRGFSSTRVEHLLQQLVSVMSDSEAYFEVGTLEGRTLEAAAHGNDGKRIYACDPCQKYDLAGTSLPAGSTFYPQGWESVLPQLPELGCVFYDADHSAQATEAFMVSVVDKLAHEAVLVLDDWDRVSVRSGAFRAALADPRWTLLREMPEYTDGLTAAPNHFGWYFGVAMWGKKW